MEGFVAIIDVTLTRDIIELEEAFAKSTIIEKDNTKYGLINLPRFYVDFQDYRQRNAATDVKNEIQKLKKQNIEGIIIDLRNNGGGYYNHCLFWEILSPDPKQSSSAFTELIEKTFGSCEAMKEQFAKAAATRFGSGWSWLCSKNGKLSICSTPNQDNPLMEIGCGGTPILGLDVWEHAYYLNYQNRRPDYITAFWNIVNWEKVEAKYQASL